MEERSNKTIMCSVFFLDIVEYSKKSVSGQISLKDRFNKYLSHAISDVPVTDRVILDTGDGAAINFLGDVEDALRAALSLREDLLNEGSDMAPPLLVRMGINLGPVRLVRDINGQPNIVGDGINVAQRVMGFADPAQILVSRSYYDAVSRLSPQYAGMFHYQGSRTDKHVREHEVYAIGYPGDKTTQKSRFDRTSGTSEIVESNLDRSKVLAQDIWNSSLKQLDMLVNNGIVKYQQAQPKQRILYVSVIAVPALLLVALLFNLTGNESRAPEVDIAQQQTQREKSVSAGTAKPAAKAKSVQESKAPVGQQSHAIPVAPEQSKPVVEVKPKPAPKKKQQAAVTPAEDIPLPKPRVNQDVVISPVTDSARSSTESRISVSCTEGTEIFVDGIRKGSIEKNTIYINTPPGEHTVIVSHPSGGIYSKNVSIGNGQTVEIRPSFCK